MARRKLSRAELRKRLWIGTALEDSSRVFFPPKSRQFHLHVLGQFGLGKSKFLEHLIRQDILNNEGLCLIDPHGSLYDAIVTWCADKQLFDSRPITLFEPAADAWTFAFNPLDFKSYPPDRVADAVDTMVKACAQVWGGEDMTRTPRLTRFLTSCFHLLGEHGLTLREALDLCTRGELQQHLTRTIHDDVLQSEWQYYRNLSEANFVEQTESTLNRLSAFLRHPMMRRAIGQSEDTINLREAMDDGQVVLVNLAGLSSENARLMGSLLISDLYAKARLRTPDKSRPFYLYVDECYQFFNDDIERIVTGMRKFGLHTTLAHQNLGQLRQFGGDAVFSAVNQIPNKVVFGGLPVEDVEYMARSLYLGEIDYEEAKHSLDKPTVTRYVRSWLQNRSESESIAHGTSHQATDSENTSETASATVDADGAGVSATVGSSTTHGHSETSGTSTTHTHGSSRGMSETFEPELAWMTTAVHSLEEQIHRHMAVMAGQPERAAIIKLFNEPPRQVKTPFVHEAMIGEDYVDARKEKVFAATPYALPVEEAEKRIRDRRTRLLKEAKQAVKDMEPDDFLE